MNQLEPGKIFAKDFRVVKLIAQGGMGAVYEAIQLDTDRRVALKLMHPSQVSDPKMRKRFAQEARVSAWIGSDHIVEVFRAGVDEPSHIPWLAMELLEGETLAGRLSRYLPAQGIPAEDVWRVLSQLCKALVAAHDKGVVHRDLKPENVFLQSRPFGDVPFTVKVLDFGIAKRITPDNPAQNRTVAIGTPLWMSPEQNEDTELTPAADVWAVGLLTFRMFTGRYYWLSANERDLNLGWLYSELMTEPLVGAQARAEMLGCETLLPAGFDAWFVRCVTRDLKVRFASAREMTDALMSLAPRRLSLASSVTPSHASLPPLPTSAPPSAPTMELRAPPTTPPLESPPPSRVSAPPRSRAWLWVAAVVLFVLGLLGAVWLVRGSADEESAVPQYETPPQSIPSPALPRMEPPSLPNMPIDPRVGAGRK